MSREDPYGAFNFKIEIDGIIVGGFTEVSGLCVETEVETRREGGVNDFEYKLPKWSKYTNLTLKRGISDTDAIWKWYQDVLYGKKKIRKNCTIYLLDNSGKNVEKWKWFFYKAFPIKWEGPSFNSTNATIATETLVLVHQGMGKQ